MQFATTNKSIYSGTNGGNPLDILPFLCNGIVGLNALPIMWMYSKLTLAGISVQLGWSTWVRI